MKSYTASYFKTHFGAVLDRAGIAPVRIDRRGREPSVIIPESEYRELKTRARGNTSPSNLALERLKSMALGIEEDIETLKSDTRSAAILKKHS
jgi:PHD/YefM family antitoxin component YafN of YafNO toxin-antitoxin module